MSNASEPNQSASPAGDEPARRSGIWLGLLALLFALAYVVPGLVGHGPWAPEAETFAMVQNTLDGGDPVAPVLDGKPNVETPPLYTLTAVGLAHALRDYLPAHDAARLATGFYLLIAFGFTVLIGRAAWGGRDESAGTIALLVLLGTLGVLYGGHLMGTDVALTAGIAMALYGLIAAPSRVLFGGLWLGTGIGLAFMAEGLFGPAILVVTALLMPLFSHWRRGRYPRALLTAVVFAAPWLLVWPAYLYQRDPALFELWFWGHNIGPYLAGIDFSAPQSADYWLRTAPWLTFPAALLALLALLFRPYPALTSPGVQASLVLSLAGWAVLVFSPVATELSALPLLVPLAVIGAGVVPRLPGWVVKPLYMVAVLLFAAAAIGLWALWIWIMQTGHPPQLDLLAAVMPMDYSFQWQPIAYAAAAIFTLAWFWIVVRYRPPGAAALLVWPAGVVLLWGLLTLLHLPWIDLAEPELAANLKQLLSALP